MPPVREFVAGTLKIEADMSVAMRLRSVASAIKV